MKETSKIYEAIRLLNDSTDIYPARAKMLLQEFIIANDTVKKSDKVNIWKFVANPRKAVRFVMTGVCYIPQKKVAVAFDTMVLLISRPDYVERETNNMVLINGASEPCGIYRKDGTAVTKEYQASDYPDCFKVIPEEETQQLATMNDRDAVARAIREAKIAFKAKTARRAMIQVADGVWIPSKRAELMLSMPEWKFTCDKERRSYKPMIYRDDNYTALFMPTMVPEYVNGNEILYLEEQ